MENEIDDRTAELEQMELDNELLEASESEQIIDISYRLNSMPPDAFTLSQIRIMLDIIDRYAVGDIAKARELIRKLDMEV